MHTIRTPNRMPSALALLTAAVLGCGPAIALQAADDGANKGATAKGAAPSTSLNAETDDTDHWLPTSHWEVLFDESEAMTAVEYARRLDYFGIELAAVSKDGQIQYASHLAERKPDRRIGKKEDEPRISLHWQRGTLAALEAKLMTKAGINTKDKTLTHYYPKAVETRLARLEKSYAGRDPSDIRRTRFKVRPLPNSQPKAYEFYVDEQDYRESGSQSSQDAPAPAAAAVKKPQPAP